MTHVKPLEGSPAAPAGALLGELFGELDNGGLVVAPNRAVHLRDVPVLNIFHASTLGARRCRLVASTFHLLERFQETDAYAPRSWIAAPGGPRNAVINRIFAGQSTHSC